MRIHIGTEQLILRSLTPEDYKSAFLRCGNPDAARYMLYPVYPKAEDVKTWLETLDPDEYEAGMVLKQTGEPIGSGGIDYKPEEDLWNIGHNLRKDHGGHGDAVEMIRGLPEPVRRNRDVRGIMGSFANENHRSRRVMEKTGMTNLEDVMLSKPDGSESHSGKRYRRLFRE